MIIPEFFNRPDVNVSFSTIFTILLDFTEQSLSQCFLVVDTRCLVQFSKLLGRGSINEEFVISQDEEFFIDECNFKGFAPIFQNLLLFRFKVDSFR